MAARKRKKIGWKGQIFMITALFSSVLFSALSVILAVGMIPTVVAAIVDRTEGRIRTLTVGAMNFAGCAPFLAEVFSKGNDMNAAVGYIIQPRTIVVIYFAAGIGYLIDWAMTGIVSSMMVNKTKKRLRDIQKEQKDMTERWGHEVTGTIPLDEFGFPRESAGGKAEANAAP